jgi:hypothetical protein
LIIKRKRKSKKKKEKRKKKEKEKEKEKEKKNVQFDMSCIRFHVKSEGEFVTSNHRGQISHCFINCKFIIVSRDVDEVDDVSVKFVASIIVFFGFG